MKEAFSRLEENYGLHKLFGRSKNNLYSSLNFEEKVSYDTGERGLKMKWKKRFILSLAKKGSIEQ